MLEVPTNLDICVSFVLKGLQVKLWSTMIFFFLPVFREESMDKKTDIRGNYCCRSMAIGLLPFKEKNQNMLLHKVR